MSEPPLQSQKGEMAYEDRSHRRWLVGSSDGGGFCDSIAGSLGRLPGWVALVPLWAKRDREVSRQPRKTSKQPNSQTKNAKFSPNPKDFQPKSPLQSELFSDPTPHGEAYSFRRSAVDPERVPLTQLPVRALMAPPGSVDVGPAKKAEEIFELVGLLGGWLESFEV